ncbi:glycoside hydrolase/deacetylase [Calocera cornea HHB12733]|uniref:Glycoside hydrolase/deacetylase n=1 Tax=Calocera cornea HHB12733 TaxID=1353952 RepID=A0A165HED4_9BASI|nr:glycoside hydrolase/deacetylase [Calocera cornea HHB12733]
MSMVDTVDNASLSASITSSNAAVASLTAAPDWETTISLIGETQQATAPFVDFFKATKTSLAPSSNTEASTINDSASEPAAELDKKGKGPAKKATKKKASKKKAEKIALDVREDAGEASGEKGGKKASKKAGKGKVSGEVGAMFASQLVKAYEAKYGAGAVWTTERLKELLAGDKVSHYIPQLVLAPVAHEPSAADHAGPAAAADAEDSAADDVEDGAADDVEDASADEAAEDAAGPTAVPAADANVSATWEPPSRLRKEKIEKLVLSGMANPEAFNRSTRAEIDLRKASEAEMIVEKVRVANVGEFDGIVAALVALEEQEDEIEGAVGRVREKELVESYQVGRRTGWDKTIAARQKEFEKLPLEERKKELERRKIADAQLEVERKQRELEEHQREKNASKKKHGKKLAKVKAKGKELVWTYGGKVVEVGITVALQAILKKFGVDEPEKVLSEVFGLGEALQGMDGLLQGGGDASRLGSYAGEDSPNDISRGMFAGEVGTPRLLKLFKKYGMKTTWFIPGHSLETFPEQMAMVRDAGHEIGLHGYSHENPVAMTLQQQKDILDHTFQLLTDFCGKPPKGSVAPWWETSAEATELLLAKGVEYDHSDMSHDCQASYLRDQDHWTKIDFSQDAESWMKPLVRGTETGLVEIPASWYLDDLPPMMFIKKSANSHGWVDTRVVEQLWRDQFAYFYREEDEFIFPITIHPDVSGRPHVLLMLERFIEWVNTHEGVQWVTMKEMADDFRAKKKPPPGTRMPEGLEA